MGIETLIIKADERLNLTCYTPWEYKFLHSLVSQYARTGSLSDKQTAKLKEIVLTRYIKGEMPHRDPEGNLTGAPFPKKEPNGTH